MFSEVAKKCFTTDVMLFYLALLFLYDSRPGETEKKSPILPQMMAEEGLYRLLITIPSFVFEISAHHGRLQQVRMTDMEWFPN